MATNNAINCNSTGLIKYDGAGSFSGVTTTTNSLLYGAASNGISNLALTDGQLAIGSTGAAPVAASLTAGSGISITPGAGTISIATTGGGMTWSVVTVNASFAVNTGTIANKAGLLTMTLPASGAIGDMIAITGINTAAGWLIAQNANQQIFIGTSSTTVGVGGSIAAINIRDSLTMVCVVSGASTIWNVIDVVGNLTIV